MSYKNRIIVILAFLLVMTGCGSGNTEETIVAPDTETDTAETVVEEDSLSRRASVLDDLPEVDFEGATFSTLTCNENIYDTSMYGEEIGSPLHDAVYLRDRTVEERFNIVFQHNQVHYSEHVGMLEKSVLAGTDEFQLYMGQAIVSANLALKDYYLNWKDVPYIQSEKPWYNQATNEAMTLNGKNYVMLGATDISAVGYAYCMYMNLDEAENVGIQNIYDTVNAGDWTYDLLLEYTEKYARDTNGDGIMEDGDFYGYATRLGDIPTFMWAFEADILSVSEDGTLNILFGDEKTVAVAERVSALYKNNTNVSTSGSQVEYDGGYVFNGGAKFVQDQALIASGFVKDSISPSFLEYEANYAIIPYPKYDAEQAAYHTISDGSHGVLCAPVTVQNTEMVGVITEACNAEAWKQIEPVYYDTALKFRGVRDEGSVAMLDLILDSRIQDLSYMHGTTGYGLSGLSNIVTGSKDTASYVASTITSATKEYQKLVDYYFDR